MRLAPRHPQEAAVDISDVIGPGQMDISYMSDWTGKNIG
jgi:hypothetical protein